MATNTLGVYNPLFYAQEALIQLESAMGMANRVHRGFDEERRSFNRGEVVNIRRPSTFTAQNAPSAAQDLNTGSVAVTLNQWKEVKFELTDKDLSFTSERIIAEHIRPAAVALADNVDQALAGLFVNVPWQYNRAATVAVTDFTGPRQVLFDNRVPLRDPMMMHMMIDGSFEAGALALSAFSQQQGAGDVGVSTQLNGNLGLKFGFNVFANQNTQEHTAGTGTITTPAVDNGPGYAVGVSLVHVDGAALPNGAVVAGDSIKFDGHDQVYVVTATPTFGTNEGDVTISPPLKAAVVNDEVVTFTRFSGSQSLAWHRNAIALVTAPLSEIGNGKGAEIATVQDPITGLSLRSRMYYDGDNSKVLVALDILYGFTLLDPNMIVRVVENN